LANLKTVPIGHQGAADGDSVDGAAVYLTTFMALVASTLPTPPRAFPCDGILRRVLARAYAEQLARLFLDESDLSLAPSSLLLRAFALDERTLLRTPSPVSLQAGEKAAEHANVTIAPLDG
jgi:hypothetical protein